MKEFSIIESFFKSSKYQRRDVDIGIGDDCAVTNVPEGQSLVVTTDTLVSGVHFPEDTEPKAIAHKAIAVNLSDLAAMGAEPAWVSLSLSLPEADEEWLSEFSSGLHEITEYYGVQLIGGDTVNGPLTITITAQGFIPKDQALKRSTARPGDWLYVTGALGDAGLGLDLAQGKRQASASNKEYLLGRLNYPTPRVLAGTTLRRLAHSCIDVSDGLLSDIKHMLNASNCGAVIHVDKLPLSQPMLDTVDLSEGLRYALSAGDDYELLFTLPEEQKGNLDVALTTSNVSATCIGQLNGMPEKLELKFENEPYHINESGYQHFA